MYREVSCGIVFNKSGQILMGKRTNGEQQWCNLGGGVEQNEDRYVALVREMFEECGICVLEADIIHVTHETMSIDPSIKLILYMYVVKRWIGEPINREPHAHSEIGWFYLENLPQPLAPGMVHLMKQKDEFLMAYRNDYIKEQS